jgi:hypothetical protein
LFGKITAYANTSTTTIRADIATTYAAYLGLLREPSCPSWLRGEAFPGPDTLTRT